MALSMATDYRFAATFVFRNRFESSIAIFRITTIPKWGS
jgi:hypothetical protein